MASLKFEGINKLPLSLVARLVLEDLVVRLLKDKDKMVTVYDLADEFGIDQFDVRVAIAELHEEGFIVGELPDQIGSLTLEGIKVGAQITAKIDQPRLGDEPIANDRTLGHDDRTEDGVLYSASVDVLSGDLPFSLTVHRGSVADPFGDGTDFIQDLRFGSAEEAWEYFDALFAGHLPDKAWTSEEGADIAWGVTSSPSRGELTAGVGTASVVYDLGMLISGTASQEYVYDDVYDELRQQSPIHNIDGHVEMWEAVGDALVTAIAYGSRTLPSLKPETEPDYSPLAETLGVEDQSEAETPQTSKRKAKKAPTA